MKEERATKKLYKTVVEKLSKVIEDGETILDKEGKPIHQEAAPAYFAQAINLLRMVGETGQEDKPTVKEKIKDLALPFSGPAQPEDYIGSPRTYN